MLTRTAESIAHAPSSALIRPSVHHSVLPGFFIAIACRESITKQGVPAKQKPNASIRYFSAIVQA